MKKIIHQLIIITLLITLFTGCSLFNKDEEEEPISEDTTDEATTDSNDSDTETDIVEPAVLAPYILIDFDSDFVDPYPLRDIPFTGDDKLKISDASIEGSDNLDLFVLNLKDAVSRKDSEKLLSMVSEDIHYTFGIGNGKTDFSHEYDLIESPANSEIWAILERILVYGGKLVYDDLYQIPYMYDTLGTGAFDAVAIGDSINMRADDSISGEIVDQLNFDYVTITDFSDQLYTIDGVDYPWVKVKKSSGTEGYVVSKFIYDTYDYRMNITKDNGYWEISVLIVGD